MQFVKYLASVNAVSFDVQTTKATLNKPQYRELQKAD